jgi:hypothetical protein
MKPATVLFIFSFMFLQMKFIMETFNNEGILQYERENNFENKFPTIHVCSSLKNLNTHSVICEYKYDGLVSKKSCSFDPIGNCIKFQTKNLISNSLQSEHVEISLNVSSFYNPTSGFEFVSLTISKEVLI